MLQFKKNGKVVMTESDQGEVKITEEAPEGWVPPTTPMPGGHDSDEQPGEPRTDNN